LLCALPQAASAVTMASSNMARICGAYRLTEPLAAQNPSPINPIPKARAHSNKDGGQAIRGNCGTPPAVCGIVVIMSVTVVLMLPAARDVGENVAVALGGTVEAEKVTVLPKTPFEGATANVKLPG